jgi:uncharacterized protein (TIGR04222 family)
MSMNNELWQKILDFDFDGPGDYTFSIRLAKENHWTRNFTQQALLEYRKFMYLAATSGSMVSPSEIVDVVWHQHLIFTQSYTDFCTLLGKQIQHIPSTHNKQEADTFKRAKEHTTRQYNSVFGTQPKAIWHNNTMLQSLNLPQSNKSIQGFLMLAVPLTVLLLIPAYLILRPVFVQINNPGFMIGVVVLAAAIFFTLKYYYNNRYLQRMIDEAEADSFIHSLHPYEVAYLKTGNSNAVLNGCLGELLHEELTEIDHQGYFTVPENRPANEPHMQQAMNKIAEYGGISHRALLEELRQKPIFGNIERGMEAVNSHVLQSRKFLRLFLINYLLMAVPAVLIYVRIVTGYLRDKPITFMLFAGFIFTALTVMHLRLLLQNPLSKTITRHYLTTVVTKDEIRRDWQWRYVAEGPALLSAAFLAMAYPNYNTNSGNWGDGGSSGCGSSCGGDSGGGSCGGGCGGCGGGD